MRRRMRWRRKKEKKSKNKNIYRINTQGAISTAVILVIDNSTQY
jgi:hypothetical protein